LAQRLLRDGQHVSGLAVSEKDNQPERTFSFARAGRDGAWQAKRSSVSSLGTKILDRPHNGDMVQGSAGVFSARDLGPGAILRQSCDESCA
jgi:hypothetical protein